jgi:hypothetical protein
VVIVVQTALVRVLTVIPPSSSSLLSPRQLMHLSQQSAERAAEHDEAAANNLKAGETAEAALPPTLLEWIGSFIVSCSSLLASFYPCVCYERRGRLGFAKESSGRVLGEKEWDKRKMNADFNFTL